MILEEMTYFQNRVLPIEAKTLFESAKNLTSHTLMEIDLTSKSCSICYDVLSKSFINPSSLDPFFLRLFSLDFKILKKDDRRKIGVLDISSNIDHRPLWNPTYYYEGKQIKGNSCNAYRAIIPSDVKFLGGKYVEIYTDPKLKNFCFPVWLQISDDAAAFKLIPIDMGEGFKSQLKSLPRPLPYFCSAFILNEDSLYFEIETTYPIESHRFFYFDRVKFLVTAAQIIKKEKSKNNRYKIFLHFPIDKTKEYSVYTTTDKDKELLIESLQTMQFPN